MLLHDSTAAPNPRRVRIFLAEKGLRVPLVQVDMRKGEHKAADFLAKNPSGKIPVLELDDGTCIGESVAICRYLEALNPEPNLMGRTPVELGLIEMHNRQLELELLSQVGTSWVNGPVVAKLAAGRFVQIPEARAQSDAAVRRFYQRLDRALADRAFMAGPRYTIADITALCTIDFAAALVELRPDDALQNLWRWHASVSARPSASA
jgi:glutathione S-transferase